jgi:LysR family hydrogen peroxide-inducible transcriptional activator
MDLAQLRYFLAVAEWGSFTVAAKKCNVSQPALSQQIAKLEKEFGSSLFDRQGRQVTPTRLGLTLQNRATEIMSLVTDTMRQMRDDGEFGNLSIAFARSIGPHLSARIVQHLKREFSDITLLLQEKSVPEIVHDCEKGIVDLALIPHPVDVGRELICEQILTEDIKVGVARSHPLAEAGSVHIEQLANERVVWMSPHTCDAICGIRDMLDEMNVPTQSAGEVQCYLLLNYLVSLGQGVAFFPNSTMPRQSGRNNVVFLDIVGRPLKRDIAICWNPKRYQTQLMTNCTKAISEFAMVEPCNMERAEPQASTLGS